MVKGGKWGIVIVSSNLTGSHLEEPKIEHTFRLVENDVGMRAPLRKE
jgi:hypothetical protein